MLDLLQTSANRFDTLPIEGKKELTCARGFAQSDSDVASQSSSRYLNRNKWFVSSAFSMRESGLAISSASRVPNLRDSRIVAKVAFVRILGLLLACAAGVAHAQSCGLTSMQENTQLVYPPIAKAAHVVGPVVLLATFDQSGKVTDTVVVNGPEMLKRASSDYVKGLQANPYTGPRQCPIIVTFGMEGEPVECASDELASIPHVQHIDLQHTFLTVKSACFTVMRDPASKKIHKFHL